MKKLTIKWLLLSIVLSIASINTMWAWWWVPGTIHNNGVFNSTLTEGKDGGIFQMPEGNTITFYNVPAGTNEFKLVKDKDWGHGVFTNKSESIISTLCSNCSNGNNKIVTNAAADITFKITDEGTWKCDVSASTPTYYIKYNWGNDGWAWSGALISNGGNMYSCNGAYSGSGSYDHTRLSSTDKDGTNTTATVKNSPSEDDNCLFEYNSSTKALTITRCNIVNNGNHIYFDNSVSNFTGNIYLVIGHDKPTAYSKVYQLNPVIGTKLYHIDFNTDNWTDVTYYAIIASSSDASTLNGDNKWGSSSLSSKGSNGYTATYTSKYDLDGTSGSYKTFLITTASSGNNRAMTITYYAGYSNLPKLEATQAAKKRDTGSSYSTATGTYPASLKLQGSHMNTASAIARNTITSTASTDAKANKTYDAIKTGTITHSYESLSSSYYFEGWGTGTTPSKTDATYEYNITAATTVYAFFSKKYTLTYDEKGTTGSSTLSVTSVSDFSGATTSGSYIPTGHSIELTASPATGYRLTSPQAWYSDASCSESLNNGTNTTYTISSLNANSEVYAKFELIPYTIAYNLNGGENNEDNPSGYNVTTATITLQAPSRDNYTFEGWYANSSFTGSAVTSIPLGSTGNKELWAKWSETPYTITPSVTPDGSGSVNTITDAKIVTPSSNITATPENVAWRFKTWAMGANVTLASTYSLTDATIKVNATANSTVSATFEPRYGLNGSLNEGGDPAGGMPGWSYPIAAASFDVIKFDGIGEGVGNGVDLEYSCSLQPNKQYKFRVYDRESGGRWGLSSAAVIPAEGVESNKKLTIFGEEGCGNVLLNTVGYGTYTFKITNMYDNGDGKYYPAIQVDRPASSQLTLGWKHYTNGTLSDGNTGGTVTAETDEGSGFAITNGQFYANGSTITFTAAPAEGYHVAGWYSDASCGTAYVSGSGDATISGDGDVTLELASVSTNKTVYVKFTEDTKEAAAGDGNWSTKVDASTLTDVVTISSTITVDVDHALAKRVILDQSGDGKAGKLVITANKGLEVAEGIWINNGSSLVAPTAEDLVLESSASGNATLIFNNSNSAAATVQMYSIASAPEGSTWKWQYAAAPAAVSALYNYYGGYLYKWNDGWQVVHGSDNTELFAGYCVSYPTSGHTFAIEGALASTDATNQELTIPAGKEWVVGNSWTAPIQIKQMTAEDFSNVTQTIYLFNTGMDNAEEVTAGSDNPAAGSYVTIPIANAGTGSLPAVISSLQGFYVMNETGSAGTLTLNYAKHVRPSGGNSIQNGAMHAPKRLQTDDKQVMTITAHGSRFTSRLVLFAHEDYTFGYDAGHDGENINSPGVGPLIYTLREDGTHDDVSAIPEYEGALVGFEAGEDSEYTFKFTYDGDGVWYLNDTKAGLSTLIKNNNTYTFDVSSDDAARFIISATPYNAPAVTTGINEVEYGSVRKQMINGTLYIIRGGRIYNAEGALVK